MQDSPNDEEVPASIPSNETSASVPSVETPESVPSDEAPASVPSEETPESVPSDVMPVSVRIVDIPASVRTVEVPANVRPAVAPASVRAVATPAKPWIALFWLLLGAILLDVVYCQHMVSGLTSPDAMDFAQCARNLMQGHGFATQILHPLGLTSASDRLHQPDTTHGVLYPFVLALAFGLFGIKDGVVIAVSSLFYVLTVPVIYFLGRRLFNAKIGGITALIFLTNSTILDYAASGTHATLYLFLATCLFYALYVMSVGIKQTPLESASAEREEALTLPKFASVLAGILTGLLYLTDPLFLWIVPVVLVAIAKMYPRRSIVALTWCGIPMLVLLLPAMVRFGMLTGNPLFGLRGTELWMNSEMHPGLLGYRFSADRLNIDRGSEISLMRRLILDAVDAIALLPHMPGSWILLFVAPSLAYKYSNTSATRIRSILLWCLLVLLIGCLFFTPNPIRLMIVFPGLLIFAVAFLRHTLDSARLSSAKVWTVSVALGVVLLAPLIGEMIRTRYPVTVAEAGDARGLIKQMPPGDWAFSDQPWLVAWYGEHAAVWIPEENITLTDLRQQFPQIRWLFLTRQTAGLSQEWDETYRGLLSWNQQYYRAEAAHTALPGILRISGSSISLLKALDGFETVPPLGTALPMVVVAQAPGAVQKASAP